MRNKFIILSLGLLLSFGMIGCNEEKKNEEKKIEDNLIKNEENIMLTPEEKAMINGNATIGAQLLVRKAVLNEIKRAKLTDKEKLEMEFVKDDAAISYYLRKILGEKINVSEEAIKKVYEENKEKLGEKELKDVHDDLKRAIVNTVQNERLVNYYNGLVEKYKLNDTLKKEFSENSESKEK